MAPVLIKRCGRGEGHRRVREHVQYARKVAEAISDGVGEAHPDAHVECVVVGSASVELISTTDLLIVGGPTHLRRMTTDFSRKTHQQRKESRSQRIATAWTLVVPLLALTVIVLTLLKTRDETGRVKSARD